MIDHINTKERPSRFKAREVIEDHGEGISVRKWVQMPDFIRLKRKKGVRSGGRAQSFLTRSLARKVDSGMLIGEEHGLETEG